MLSSFRYKPVYKISVWIMAGILFILTFLMISNKDSPFLNAGDSVNYWAAGQLMLNGDNPYLSENVLNLRYIAGNFKEFPQNAIFQIMYPPWAMTLLLPLGIFDFTVSSILWLIIHVSVIIFSANRIWKIYNGPQDKKYILYLATVFFAPTFIVLVMGHFTTLHLLGLVGFLYFLQNSNNEPNKEFAAGFCAAIVLIKPQLLYLFLIALLIWSMHHRRWKIILGGMTFIFTTSFISIVLNPLIFNQYVEAFASYSLGVWATPTLGTVLRAFSLNLISKDIEWLQVLPILFGLAWLIFYYRKHHKTWDWVEELPLVILVSFVTCPYMWTYDMIVLLIPVISLTIKLIEQPNRIIMGIFGIIFLAMNLSTIILHRFYDDFWFVWYAPGILVLYLIGSRISSTNQLVGTIPGESQSPAASQ